MHDVKKNIDLVTTFSHDWCLVQINVLVWLYGSCMVEGKTIVADAMVTVGCLLCGAAFLRALVKACKPVDPRDLSRKDSFFLVLTSPTMIMETHSLINSC